MRSPNPPAVRPVCRSPLRRSGFLRRRDNHVFRTERPANGCRRCRWRSEFHHAVQPGKKLPDDVGGVLSVGPGPGSVETETVKTSRTARRFYGSHRLTERERLFRWRVRIDYNSELIGHARDSEQPTGTRHVRAGWLRSIVRGLEESPPLAPACRPRPAGANPGPNATRIRHRIDERRRAIDRFVERECGPRSLLLSLA